MSSDTANLRVVITSTNASGPGFEQLKAQAESAGVAVERLGIRTTAAGKQVAQLTGTATAGGGATGIQAFHKGVTDATNATVALTTQTARLPGHLVNANEQMSKLAQGIGHGLGLFSSFGAGIGVAVITAAITKAVADATRAFSEFELQLRGVNAVLGQTGAVSEHTFRGMEADVRALSSEFGLSTTTITKSLYDVISAGFQPGAEAMQVLRASATLAIGGMGDLDTAAKATTTVMRAYHLPVSDAAKVSDQIAEAVRIGKFNLDEFTRSMGTAIPLASQLGISFADVAAAAATASQLGVPAATALEGERAALQNLLRPSDEARRLIDALARSGKIEADVLSVQSIAQNGLIGTLQKMSNAVGGNDSAMALLLGDITAVNFAAAVTGRNFDAASDSLRRTSTAAGQASAMLQEVDKSGSRAADHLSAQWNVLREEFGELASQDIGLPIVGALSAAADQMDVEGRAIRRLIGQITGAFQALQGDPAQRFTAEVDSLNTKLAQGLISAQSYRRQLATLVGEYENATRAATTFGQAVESTAAHRRQERDEQQASSQVTAAQAKSTADVRAATDALQQVQQARAGQPSRDEQQAVSNLREQLQEREKEAQQAADAEQRRTQAHVKALQDEAKQGQEALQRLRDASGNARAELQELSRIRVQGTADQEQRIFDLGTRTAQDRLVIESTRLVRLQARQQGLPPPPIDRAAVRAAARDQRLAEQEATVAELQGRTTLAPAQRAVDLALQPPQERAAAQLLADAQAAHQALVDVEGESQAAFERRLREMEQANKAAQEAAQKASDQAQEKRQAAQDDLQALRDQNEALIKQAEHLAAAAEQAREKLRIAQLEDAIRKGGLEVPPPIESAAPQITALNPTAIPTVNRPAPALRGTGVPPATNVSVTINNPVVDSEARTQAVAQAAAEAVLDALGAGVGNSTPEDSAGSRYTR